MNIIARTWELRDMLSFRGGFNGPLAIRYPRDRRTADWKEFRSSCRNMEGGDALRGVRDRTFRPRQHGEHRGEHVREKLKEKGQPCTLVNARFVKPLDTDMIDRLCKTHKLIVTMEENVLRGGMGMYITKYIHENTRRSA